MANTVASRKNKGRKLQQYIRDIILSRYNDELSINDVSSAPMGVNGSDIILSEKAIKIFPYSIEAKNTERLNIWKAIDQNETYNTSDLDSVIVFKRNRSKPYAVIDLIKFIELTRHKFDNLNNNCKTKDKFKYANKIIDQIDDQRTLTIDPLD